MAFVRPRTSLLSERTHSMKPYRRLRPDNGGATLYAPARIPRRGAESCYTALLKQNGPDRVRLFIRSNLKRLICLLARSRPREQRPAVKHTPVGVEDALLPPTPTGSRTYPVCPTGTARRRTRISPMLQPVPTITAHLRLVRER